MKISLNWLKDYVSYDGSAAELVDLLTRSGLEVDTVETRGADFPNVVVCEILASDPHPNADRLSVCQVNDGRGQPRQIVCGAKNYRVGDKVPLALPGAVLPGDFKIKVGKLRGVESEGMLCSAKELRLADDADGLLILPPSAVPGEAIVTLYPPEAILDLEVTSNRPDWLCHTGVAREVAVYSGATFELPTIPTVPSADAGDIAQIAAPAECPFYSVRRISDVKVGPSPDWLRARLEAVGLRPINNVVDATNFVMFELGQPLHAFDAAKVTGGIVIRNAAADEPFLALDGRTYTLAPHQLVIADSAHVLALAGVMGGETSGVTDGTTDVLLESAFFNAPTIRRAARELGLHSDSSHRFERGVDPAGVAAASARAAALIVEIAGGSAAEELLTAGDLPALEWQVALRHDRCRLLLGMEIPDAEIARALSALGLRRAATDVPGISTWTIPGFRGDLRREVDLIEEVIRVIGIDQIDGKVSGAPAHASAADSAYDAAITLRRQLQAAGFHEGRTSTLVSRADTPPHLRLEVRNPLGDEQSALRPSMIPGLLGSLQRNLNAGTSDVRLFEIGRVFSAAAEEEIPCVALVLTGLRRPPSWRDASAESADIFDLKGLLEMLIPGAVFKPTTDARYGLALEVRAGGFVAGVLGELAPGRARALDARGPVVVAEIRLDVIQATGGSAKPFVPIPKFPAVARDVAVVLPAGQPYGPLRQAVLDAKEPLLESVTLFDIFTDPTGARLAADRKSLAFALTFRSPERTLTTDEINAACDRIKGRLRSSFPIEFRE